LLVDVGILAVSGADIVLTGSDQSMLPTAAKLLLDRWLVLRQQGGHHRDVPVLGAGSRCQAAATKHLHSNTSQVTDR